MVKWKTVTQEKNAKNHPHENEDRQFGANPVTSFGDFRDLDVWKH
jgi:hypothetical protein